MPLFGALACWARTTCGRAGTSSRHAFTNQVADEAREGAVKHIGGDVSLGFETYAVYSAMFSCAWDANRILIGTGTTPDNLANASRYTPMASFRSWTWPGPGALGEFEYVFASSSYPQSDESNVRRTLPPCRWLPQPPVPHLEPSRKLAQSWWPHMCTDLLLRSAFLLLASMRRAASVKGGQHQVLKFAHTCKPEQGSSRTSVREGPEQLKDATRGWILKIAGEGPTERFQRRPGRSAPPAHELRARRRPSSNVKP